jgi:hypothetical protein
MVNRGLIAATHRPLPKMNESPDFAAKLTIGAAVRPLYRQRNLTAIPWIYPMRHDDGLTVSLAGTDHNQIQIS